MEQTDRNGRILFEKKLHNNSGSAQCILPRPLCDFIGVEPSDDVLLSGYEGKKGKYIAIWKKEE
jgi:hypothetical protein